MRAATMRLAGALMAAPAAAEAPRLSHRSAPGDVRHQVARRVADEVAAAGVDLDITTFPSASLFKPTEQDRPLTRGQLDTTAPPLSCPGGRRPAYVLVLMPGPATSHDHAARHRVERRASPVMEAIAARCLVQAKGAGGAPLDPVARFHPGDVRPARADNPGGDTGPSGLRDAQGVLGRLHDPGSIERNHEAFAGGGAVAASASVRRLLKG